MWVTMVTSPKPKRPNVSCFCEEVNALLDEPATESQRDSYAWYPELFRRDPKKEGRERGDTELNDEESALDMISIEQWRGNDVNSRRWVREFGNRQGI